MKACRDKLEVEAEHLGNGFLKGRVASHTTFELKDVIDFVKADLTEFRLRWQ